MLSRGGLKRRSSAYTVSATAASTVISPDRVEAAEIDQHHVDHVRCRRPRAARGRGSNGEMLCGAGRVSIAYDKRRHAGAGEDREHQVARAPNPRARGDARVIGLDALRQPAQAEQEQHDGDDLDDELRQRKVGGGEPHEREANDEADDCEHRERGEAMVFRLPRGRHGAHHADEPERDELGRGGHARAVTPRRVRHPTATPVPRAHPAPPSAAAAAAAAACRRTRAHQRATRLDCTSTRSNSRLAVEAIESAARRLKRPRASCLRSHA